MSQGILHMIAAATLRILLKPKQFFVFLCKNMTIFLNIGQGFQASVAHSYPKPGR